MYDLGSRLKFMRKKRRITQKELAQRINKSVSAVSSYESNAQLPPLDVITDIAACLNTSIDYLVGIEKDYTISTRVLSQEQAELLDLLLSEFQSDNPSAGLLTHEQILLLQKLIHYFIIK